MCVKNDFDDCGGVEVSVFALRAGSEFVFRLWQVNVRSFASKVYSQTITVILTAI